MDLLATLDTGNNSWQLTAATLVGLMSIPGLVVLYGGVMQKRWSVNSMMMAFVAFAIVLILWCLFALQDGASGSRCTSSSDSGFFGNFWGKPGSILSSSEPAEQAHIPEYCRKWNSPSRSRRWPTSRSSSRRSRRS